MITIRFLAYASSSQIFRALLYNKYPFSLPFFDSDSEPLIDPSLRLLFCSSLFLELHRH